jgi:hypothetical protein
MQRRAGRLRRQVDIIVRTVLGEMASDLQSGETISGSAGLAIWPSLSYKIPGN